ncbi:hypothetical protein HJG60_007796 [Phyllostomus discolor]|uniref:Uncharacterized protein n=1 Tax=Phyllostomus discolor TaxID=89673 RepID=A0A834BDR3_9CHIR|nr:hypothetical protein HJG60_007796 [Phyllostomus discolor]
MGRCNWKCPLLEASRIRRPLRRRSAAAPPRPGPGLPPSQRWACVSKGRSGLPKALVKCRRGGHPEPRLWMAPKSQGGCSCLEPPASPGTQRRRSRGPCTLSAGPRSARPPGQGPPQRTPFLIFIASLGVHSITVLEIASTHRWPTFSHQMYPFLRQINGFNQALGQALLTEKTSCLFKIVVYISQLKSIMSEIFLNYCSNSPGQCGSVSWNIIPCTKRSWIQFPVREILRLLVQSLVKGCTGGN